MASATDLVIDLTNLTRRIHSRLGGALTPHGLSLSEFLVLRQLANCERNQMRRVDLAASVGLTASGVTRLLNPMEKTGLIQKEQNARDARVSFVTISDSGKRVFDEASVAFDHAANALLAPVAIEQRKALKQLANASA